MATVTITITDAPGGGGAMFVVESKPDIPLVDRLGTPDVDKLTDAQTMAICEQVKQPDFRVFLR
jgi:hypothetical protein